MKKLFVQNEDGSFEELSAVAIGVGVKEIKKTLLSVSFSEYLKDYTSKKKSKYTRQNEKKYFFDLCEFFKKKNLNYCHEVLTQHVIEYKNEMLLRVAPPTVNRQFNTIKNYFNILYKQNIIYLNPCLHIKAEKTEKPKIDLWSGRDFIRVKNGSCEAVKNILYFMWYTGARSCEAVNLLWTDINYDDQIIYLRSDKNSGVARTFPLTTRVDRLLHKIKIRGLYVFGGGSKFTSDSLGKKVKASVLKNAINKKITAKGIRHTFCTRLIEKNIENATIQELMGHASWRTTENYKHISKKYLNRVAKYL